MEYRYESAEDQNESHLDHRECPFQLLVLSLHVRIIDQIMGAFIGLKWQSGHSIGGHKSK